MIELELVKKTDQALGCIELALLRGASVYHDQFHGSILIFTPARCAYLSGDDRCRVHGCDEKPSACIKFPANPTMTPLPMSCPHATLTLESMVRILDRKQVEKLF